MEGRGNTHLARLAYRVAVKANDGKQRATIGFSKMEPEIIPCVNSIGQHGQTYLEWNPIFKMRFLECFGATMWAAFKNCCGLAKNVLDLKLNMHYNLL